MKLFVSHKTSPRLTSVGSPRAQSKPVSSDKLKETAEKLKAEQGAKDGKVEEIGGPSGPEPTRYGDWERNGICSDF